jgi:Tol biopolymer transport system component
VGQLNASNGSNGSSDSVVAERKATSSENGNNGNGHHPEISHQVEERIHRAIETDGEELYSNDAEAREYVLRFKSSTVASRRSWKIGVAVALAVLVLVGTAFWAITRNPSALPVPKQRILTDASSEKPIWDAAISPDGKYLVYADNRKMYLKVLATGDTRDLPQPEGLQKEQLGTWSLGGWFPDSSRFLANLHGNQGTSIWAVSVLGTPPHKLRDDAEAHAVSPDGTSIAFTADGIWLMDSSGGHARTFVKAPNNHFFYSDIQWSPDGKRIAYKLAQVAEPYKLPRVADSISPTEVSIQTRDLNGQSPTTVLSDMPFSNFRWMPDGRILFTRGGEEVDSTSFNLWEIHVNSQSGLAQDKPRQITNWEGMSFDSLSSTSDGKRLAYVRHSNARSIYVSEFDKIQHTSNSTRRLTTTQSWDFPYDWTADGKAVIFMSNRHGHWNIYKQALDKDFPEMIVAGADGAEALAPKLSPDGAWVIYTEYGFDSKRQISSDRIMRAPLAGGPSEFITLSPNHRGKSCSRSPANLCVIAELSQDNSQLIFSSFDPFAGRGKEVARIPLKPKMNCWWTLSPDGKKISYLEPGSSTIHVLPLNHSRPYEIHVEGWPGFWIVTSSANGDGYFVSSPTSGGITLLFVEPSGKAHPLLKNGSDRNWVIPSRDGKLLATMDESADGNVWIAENF